MEIFKLDQNKLNKLKLIGDIYNIRTLKFNNDIKYGRILQIRKIGKITFLIIKDELENIQLLANNNTKDYEVFVKIIDKGDILFIDKCKQIKTNSGDIAFEIHSWKLVAKTFIEHPDKHAGLKNLEILQRQRYLALLYENKILENLINRSKMLKILRNFMYKQNYFELDTPILENEYGGATADPFITKINHLNKEFYLSVSPQLKLKELIIGGFKNVFSITHAFRNESIDKTHHPEFLTFECYAIGKNFKNMINLTMKILKKINFSINKSNIFKFINMEIDLSKYKIIKFYKLFKLYNINYKKPQLYKKDINVHDFDLLSIEEKHLKLFDKLIAPFLIQPTFVINLPKISSPLCKQNKTNKNVIDQAELYIAGIEIANMYTEQNNPLLQSERFKETNTQNQQFEQACYYGMPPLGGLGIGLERVIMLISNSHHIREVIPFPLITN